MRKAGLPYAWEGLENGRHRAHGVRWAGRGGGGRGAEEVAGRRTPRGWARTVCVSDGAAAILYPVSDYSQRDAPPGEMGRSSSGEIEPPAPCPPKKDLQVSATGEPR